MKSSSNRRPQRQTVHGLGLGLVALACASLLVACGGGSSTSTNASANASSSGPLTVWIDTARVPYEKAYMAAHPGANVKWVIYNGNTNGTGVLQSKFALWNRTGWPSTAPDVMFDTQNYDAVQLASPPYNDLLNLKPYVPASVLGNYAAGSLSNCTAPGGQIVCLRNDNAADVLWVNQKLYNQFFPGKPVPTTWAGIIADGEALQASHPGYLAGDIGDQYDEDLILWANECPLNQVTGATTVNIDPTSSNCTTIANMLAPVEGKSFTTTGALATGFDAKKVVMMVGPLWYGTAVFQTGTPAGVPTGTVAAYPPPAATNGAHVTGALGGGLWLVSGHSKHPAAAAALAQYMSTSPNVQKAGVDAGLPDYVPDQAGYLTSLNSVFANPASTEAAWKTAAAEVWTGWSPVPWSTDAVWGSTVLPNLTANPPKPFAAQLLPYAEALANYARQAGFSVKSPASAVSSPS